MGNQWVSAQRLVYLTGPGATTWCRCRPSRVRRRRPGPGGPPTICPTLSARRLDKRHRQLPCSSPTKTTHFAGRARTVGSGRTPPGCPRSKRRPALPRKGGAVAPGNLPQARPPARNAPDLVLFVPYLFGSTRQGRARPSRSRRSARPSTHSRRRRIEVRRAVAVRPVIPSSGDTPQAYPARPQALPVAAPKPRRLPRASPARGGPPLPAAPLSLAACVEFRRRGFRPPRAPHVSWAQPARPRERQPSRSPPGREAPILGGGVRYRLGRRAAADVSPAQEEHLPRLALPGSALGQPSRSQFQRLPAPFLC